MLSNPVLGDETKTIDPDTILAVVPEHCSGPGWANAIVWVYWRDDNGQIQQDCLQLNEQSNEIITLFTPCAATHEAMIRAVRRHVAK